METRQIQSRQCWGGWAVDCRDGGRPESALARIRESLRDGRYRPAPVRRVQIPKPGGGVRELGIPTVTDRLIQQALLQVLQPLIDRTFSEHSYGFRPGRRAHDVVLDAQRYVQDGYRVVVDVDLEQFFDRVNHDILMERLARRIDDKAVLRLIRRYLVLASWMAGWSWSGMRVRRKAGRCRRSWPTCWWTRWIGNWRCVAIGSCATPTTATLRSRRAGERVLEGLCRLYDRLHLKGNETKTAIAPATGGKFLGYELWRSAGDRIKCAVARKALEAFKQRIREMTRRLGGRSLPEGAERLRTYMPGWKTYFQLAQTPKVFRELDEWLRHRLRALQLKHWRRGTRMYRGLKAMGAS